MMAVAAKLPSTGRRSDASYLKAFITASSVALTLIGWAALARQAHDDYAETETATQAVAVETSAVAQPSNEPPQPVPAEMPMAAQANQSPALPTPEPLPTLVPLLSPRLGPAPATRAPSRPQPVVKRSAPPVVQQPAQPPPQAFQPAPPRRSVSLPRPAAVTRSSR